MPVIRVQSEQFLVPEGGRPFKVLGPCTRSAGTSRVHFFITFKLRGRWREERDWAVPDRLGSAVDPIDVPCTKIAQRKIVSSPLSDSTLSRF